MSKETLIAILVGFGIGLTAALLILILPGKIDLRKNEKNHITTQDLKEENNSQTGSESNIELTIDTPEQNAVIESDSEETEISGKAPAGSKIVFLSIAGQKNTRADGSGNFSVKMPLAEGENKIQAAAYKDKKTPQVKVLTVYYAE